MTYTVEKGIPIPESPSDELHGLTAVLRQMEIGDSVYLANRGDTKLGSYWQRLAPKAFTARKSVTGGVRVWRVE